MIPLRNIKTPTKYFLKYNKNGKYKGYIFTPIEKLSDDMVTGYCYGKGIRTFKCANIMGIKKISKLFKLI